MPKYKYTITDKDGFFLPEFLWDAKIKAILVRDNIVPKEHRREFPVKKIKLQVV